MIFRKVTVLISIVFALCGYVGAEWQKVSGYWVERLYAFQGTSDVYAITKENGIIKSTDGGIVWAQKNNGIDLTNQVIKEGLSCMASDNSGNIFLAVNYAWKFYRSSDGGETWQEVSTTGFPTNNSSCMVFDSYTNALFLGAEGGIYKSTDKGETWQSMGGDYYVYSIYSGKADASGSTGMLLIGTYYEGIMKSVDGGATWNSKGGEYWLTSIISDPDDYLYAISADSFYRSEDYGETWDKRVSYGQFGSTYVYMSYDEENGTIFATGGSCSAEGKPLLFRSSDRGDNWQSEEVGPGPSESSRDVVSLPGGIVIVGTIKGIYRQGPPTPGDINGDYKVDISDVILSLRIAIDLPVTIGGVEYNPPYTEEILDIADMDNNEEVNISDVILILRNAIGL
jgi:photosystem II stability/assembly factor-like uncharacterized protein